MMNKKFAVLLIAGALTVTMGTTTALAATVSNPVCPYNNCTYAGEHQHDNMNYAAHTAGDGHAYHTNCNIADCTQTGSHQHNGNHNNGGQRGGHRGRRHC